MLVNNSGNNNFAYLLYRMKRQPYIYPVLEVS